VEEKICVLDTGIAHRREGSCERSMGRDTCESSVGHLGEGTSSSPPTLLREQEGWRHLEDSQLFFVDAHASANYWDWQMGQEMICYESLDPVCVLGDASETSRDYGAVDENRCFNCGSPAHFLASCPKPYDHALINLSRQLAAFFRNNVAKYDMQRIHVVEGWKQQRLEWISCFGPGEIRGPLLREALGMFEGDAGNNVPWLENMLFWGYPKGWTGKKDPKEKMRDKISGEMDDPSGLWHAAQHSSESTMIIFSGDGQDEEVDLSVEALHGGTTAHNIAHANDLAAGNAYRWASYPDSHFLYTYLPIYCGQTLPPLGHEESTAFPISLYAGESSGVCQLPSFQQPPPPSISPPPLPLSSPPFTLGVEDEELDMDLSE